MKCINKSKSCNTGFSLVELIVVVLIMGILTITLTPKVMQLIDKSRIAVDAVKDAIDITYANEELFSAAKDKEIKVTITHFVTSTKIEADSSIKTKDGRTFEKVFEENAGGSIDDFVFKKVHDAVLVYKNGVLLPEDSSDTEIPIEFSDDLSEDE